MHRHLTLIFFNNNSLYYNNITYYYSTWIYFVIKKKMVNDRCLCPVAASTHQVGAPSLSASLSAMIRWFVDGSLLIGKSHMQSGWEAAVSLVNASPADSTAWQATGRIWTQAPGYKHTQSGKELYIRLILLKLFTLWKFHI